MVVVPSRQPWGVRDDVSVLLDVDELVLVRPDQLDEGLQVVGGAVHHHASDADRLAAVDLRGALAVEVDGPEIDSSFLIWVCMMGK